MYGHIYVCVEHKYTFNTFMYLYMYVYMNVCMCMFICYNTENILCVITFYSKNAQIPRAT